MRVVYDQESKSFYAVKDGKSPIVKKISRGQAAEIKGQIEAAKDTGFLESMAIGAGHRLTQAANLLPGVDMPTTDMSYLREENPWSTGIGEALPYIASAGLGGAGIPGQMIAAGASGAAMSEGEGWRRAIDAGINSAFAGVGTVTARVLRNLWQSRRIPVSAAAKKIEDTGGYLTPGQKVGVPDNKLIRKEAYFNRGSYAGDQIDDILAANNRNTAQLATDAVFGRGNVQGPLDADMVKLATTELRGLMDQVGRRLGSAVKVPKSVVGDVIDEFRNIKNLNRSLGLKDNFKWTMPKKLKSGEVIQVPRDDLYFNGKTFMQVRERFTEALGEAARRTDQAGLGKTLGVIDDVIKKEGGRDTATMYKTVRERYEVLKTLERVLSSEGSLTRKSPWKTLKTQLGERNIDINSALNPETKVLMKNLEGMAADSTAPLRSSGTAEGLRAGKLLDPEEIVSGAHRSAYMRTKDWPVMNVPAATYRGLGKSRPSGIAGGAAGQAGGQGVLDMIDTMY